MNNVITVLEKMASNASIIDESCINNLLINSTLNAEQIKAFAEVDAEKLANTTDNFPDILAFAPVLPAEDEEPENNEDEEPKESSIKQAKMIVNF